MTALSAANILGLSPEIVLSRKVVKVRIDEERRTAGAKVAGVAV